MRKIIMALSILAVHITVSHVGNATTYYQYGTNNDDVIVFGIMQTFIDAPPYFGWHGDKAGTCVFEYDSDADGYRGDLVDWTGYAYFDESDTLKIVGDDSQPTGDDYIYAADHTVYGDPSNGVLCEANRRLIMTDDFLETFDLDFFGDLTSYNATGGSDVVYGWRGDDYIYGGSGADYLYGMQGADEIWGSDGVDHIYEGTCTSGNPLLSGGAGNDYIYGGACSDEMYGNDGNDYLLGYTGNDLIYGGEHNDTIDGSSGTDSCYGQGGSNTITNCEFGS